MFDIYFIYISVYGYADIRIIQISFPSLVKVGLRVTV